MRRNTYCKHLWAKYRSSHKLITSSYTVATRNTPPPANEDGSTSHYPLFSVSFHDLYVTISARPEPTVSWHSVLSFNPGANNYLKTLKKGSQVYVEAHYQLKDADPSADPDSPAAQKQIFLRHSKYFYCSLLFPFTNYYCASDMIKVLSRPRVAESSEEGNE